MQSGLPSDQPFQRVHFSMAAFLCCVVMGAQMLQVMLILTRFGQQHVQSELLLGAMLAGFLLMLVTGIFVLPTILPPVMFHAWWLVLAFVLVVSVLSVRGEVFLVLGLLLLVSSFAFALSPAFLPAALIAIWLANRWSYGHIGFFALLGAVFAGVTYQLLALSVPDKSFFLEGQGRLLSTLAFSGGGLVAGMTYRWMEERIMRNNET